MNDLEKRIASIEERNQRVEMDKAWETSWTRRVSIALLTYVVIALCLSVIGNDKPFINSLIPVLGFLLSTLALKFIRSIWQR